MSARACAYFLQFALAGFERIEPFLNRFQLFAQFTFPRPSNLYLKILCNRLNNNSFFTSMQRPWLLKRSGLTAALNAHFCYLTRRTASAPDHAAAPIAGCDHPAFAFNPAASIPAIAQASSLSEVSPLIPTAPSRTSRSWTITPPGTGTRAPFASVFT